MTCTSKRKLRKGQSTNFVFRWLDPAYIYKAITGVQQTAPVRLDVVGHGITDGNYFAVTGVKGGGSQLNGDPDKIRDYHKASVVDVDTIEINEINAAAWAAWESGGHIQYRAPINLTGCTAEGQIRENEDSTIVLKTFSTTEGSIIIDPLEGLVTIVFDPTKTDGLDTDSGKVIFDYKLIFPSGEEKYSEVIELTLIDGATQ